MSSAPPLLDGVGRTSEDAARGKLAAVAAGYYTDGFARTFVPEGLAGRSPGPLLNRGHYARVAAVGSICEQFLSRVSPCRAQVISLGAGFDTRFWSLCELDRRPRLFVELDQPAVVSLKAARIRASPELMRWLPGVTAAEQGAVCGAAEGGGLHSAEGGYFLGAADIRRLSELESALDAAGWRPEEPTLLLAECVLVYLPPEASSALLAWFGARSHCAALAIYEQILPDDAFGRMMQSNLRRRGCPLLSLPGCPDLAAQEARCLDGGWSRAEAESVLRLFDSVVTPAERRRVERLEMMDEVEEWRLMLEHYCVLLAVRETSSAERTNPPLLEGLQLRAPIERLFPQADATDASNSTD